MITISGRYVTRDGRAVRIVSMDGTSVFPVVGFIEGDNGPSGWTAEGFYYEHRRTCDEDLVEYRPSVLELADAIGYTGDRHGK